MNGVLIVSHVSSHYQRTRLTDTMPARARVVPP
jgi:hypothetical protein